MALAAQALALVSARSGGGNLHALPGQLLTGCLVPLNLQPSTTCKPMWQQAGSGPAQPGAAERAAPAEW